MEDIRKKQANAFRNRLYKFTIKLIEFIDSLPQDSVSRRMSDQLLRSGTGILANYVEGQSATNKKDLANSFAYSLKSSNESHIWLCILRDSKRTPPKKVTWFLKELDEFSTMFASNSPAVKGNDKT